MPGEQTVEKTYSILIKLRRNRDVRIIGQKLGATYEAVDPQQYEPGNIDLCIVDQHSWNNNSQEFEHIRRSQHPLLVPVLMLISSNEFKQLSPDILENIEHLLTKPVQADRLTARLRSLTRLRERSLQSEQRQHDLELQASVIEASMDGIAILDQEGIYIYVNQAHARIFGYDHPDELVGKSWRILYEDQELDRFDEQVMPQFSTLGKWRGEALGVQQDGSPIEHELSLTKVDSHHFVCIVRDITQRKQTQRKLKKELTRFNQLFNNDPSAIAVTDPGGFISRVNPSFERLFGYPEEEVKGKDIGLLLTNSNLEYSDYQRQMDLVRREDYFQEETVRYDSEHNPISVLLGGARVEEDDETTALFHIFTDISNQKKVEERNRELLKRERKLRTQAIESRERFKSMFESSPVALALLEGPEFRYTYVNQAYKKMFAGKDLLEKPLLEVLPEAKEQGYIDLLEQVLETGEPYHAEEEKVWFWLKKEGDYKYMYRNFEYKPLLDSKNIPYGILVSAVDVTDQVMYREKVKQRLQEKTTLLEEIHHRVKNNLAIISGLLFMQTEQAANPEVRDNLKDSQNRIQSMALVHEQLYNQAETDADINLRNYLPELINTIKGTHENQDQDIEVTVTAAKVFIPLTKAIPLGLLTTELVTNAYKHAFTNRKQGKITIRLEKEENCAKLCIHDDGVGLPEEINLDSGNLGMQIIRNLVAQLEGTIDFESEQGEGTKVMLEIPR